MPQYTYLIAAEGGDGTPHVFSCPKGWKAELGDFVEHDGELFLVEKHIHVSTDSEEFKLIAELTDIREADAIFSRIWTKEEEQDG